MEGQAHLPWDCPGFYSRWVLPYRFSVWPRDSCLALAPSLKNPENAMCSELFKVHRMGTSLKVTSGMELYTGSPWFSSLRTAFIEANASKVWVRKPGSQKQPKMKVSTKRDAIFLNWFPHKATQFIHEASIQGAESHHRTSSRRSQSIFHFRRPSQLCHGCGRVHSSVETVSVKA